MSYDNIGCVDLTSLFRSCVKTIQMRNKAMGVSLPASKIFPSTSSKVYSKAKDIKVILTNHNKLLKEHRRKYLIDSTNDILTDLEKNNLEKVVSTNITILEEKIKSFDNDVRAYSKEHQTNKDANDCYEGLVLILRSNLHAINLVFRELKDLRQNRQKNKDKLSRLQRPTSVKSNKPLFLDDATFKKTESSNNSTNKGYSETDGKAFDESKNPSNHIVDNSNEENSQKVSNVNNNYFEEEMSNLLEDLSPEEQQLLEEENEHLFQELQSNRQEVRNITKQVVELGKMQDMLTENVEIQAHQIEEIQTTIMTATDRVQEGNEQVREAMRKDAGFRVWIMFFLIMMSFTILFLDWYNA